jgi:hypothetical protein
LSLNLVTLSWDVQDFIQEGVTAFLTLVPNTTLTDGADNVVITNLARTVSFLNGTGSLAGIVANDNSQITPAGWAYQVTITTGSGVVVYGPEYIQINFADGASQNLADIVPAQSVVAMAPYLPLHYPTGATAGFVWTTDASGNGSWEPSSGGGNIDGGSAATGQFPVGNIDGGNA